MNGPASRRHPAWRLAAQGLLLLAYASGLTGCQPHLRRKSVQPVEVADGGLPWITPPAPRKPSLPDPPPEEDDEPPPAIPPAAKAPVLDLPKTAKEKAEKREDPGPGLRTALSTEPIKSELENSTATELNDRLVMGSEKKESRPLARPDGEALEKPTPPLRYLSPAPHRSLPVSQDWSEDGVMGPRTGGFSSQPASPDDAAAMEPPPLTDLQAGMPSIAFVEPNMAGSYRLQVSTMADCSSPVIDRVYSFVDEIDLHHDLGVRGSPDGIYWVRVAFIDLLDFQQPFGAARPYRFRR